jgi:hypothetical protein
MVLKHEITGEVIEAPWNPVGRISERQVRSVTAEVGVGSTVYVAGAGSRADRRHEPGAARSHHTILRLG